EVVDALGSLLDDEPLAELGVLRRDADRAPPRVAVVALAGRDADRPLVVGDAGNLLVAVQRHQSGVADRDRLRAEGEALGDVAASAASWVVGEGAAGPGQAGCRAGERWSMPAGSERISATCSVTFWPIRWPPRPTLQPWPMKNSHASASIRWCGLNPYRLWM